MPARKDQTGDDPLFLLQRSRAARRTLREVHAIETVVAPTGLAQYLAALVAFVNAAAV
jgi:hypothetical protein